MHELPRIVAMTPRGTAVDVRLLRKGREQTVQVKVGERPQQPQQAAVEGGTTEGELGLAVQELTPDIARSLGLPSAQGVVVTGVEEGSPTDEVGIRRGDVILEVNQQKIANLQDYREALGRVGEEEPVLLLMRRGGQCDVCGATAREVAPNVDRLLAGAAEGVE